MPEASLTLTPRASSAFLAVPVGAESRSIIARNVVPAWEPFIPTLPSSPAIADTSWIDIPSPLATGATYFIVSPSSSTLTFAVVMVLEITSTTPPRSFACNPNPDNTSLAISDALARSICPTVARDSTPGIPAIMSDALNPAMARYCIP